MAKKVLIYNIGMLGDVLTTIPAHRAIRRHFGPDAHLTLMQLKVPEGRITPADVLLPQGLVDEVINYERGGRLPIKELKSLLKLKLEKFDAVCYLAPYPRSPKQVERDKTFFKLAGISQQIGFVGQDEAAYMRRVEGQPNPEVRHQVISRLERLRQGGVLSEANDLAFPWLKFSPQQVEAAHKWVNQRQAEGRTLVAFGIKTARTCNDWPFERFAELGRRIISEEIGLPVVVGGPGEKNLAAGLIAEWGDGLNACGEFAPLDSGALLSLCRVMIGLDTGTTHLARAAGAPVVAIYGDRGPHTDWHPFGEEVRVLRMVQPCGGCMAEDCPVAGHPCMSQITTDMVMKAVQSII